MPLLAAEDVATMRTLVFFDGPDAKKALSRFWILITLAAVIAAAGVVADSTATVIGAMIVAPLMVPIQGTMLAVVLGDRANLVRSIALVVGGALTAIAIGFVVGLLIVHDVDASNNSQVAARVAPRLIDLLAALATGVVGSVALARSDIASTLPGVAIAISLVPPLSVVGLTLEGGEAGESMGALLLFFTNVAAILATGTIVMAVYGAYRNTDDDVDRPRVNRRHAMATIAALVVLVTVPLTITSVRITQHTTEELEVREASEAWAGTTGWDLVAVVGEEGKTIARLEGALPVPDIATLRDDLRRRGVDLDHVRVELLPRETIDLGAD